MDEENETRIREKINEGITYFNNCEFFLAHETFEDAWRMDHSRRRILIQGLVQFSVGCFHAKRQNWEGAEKVLSRARKNLMHHQDPNFFVDLAVTLSQLDVLIEKILPIKNIANEHIELIVNSKLVLTG